MVNWTGPFKTPTGAECGSPNNPACDNFRLNIIAPSFPFDVLIQLSPANGGDWDLEVYGPDGKLVDKSGQNPGVPETVVLNNPASGTYTVSAVPFAPAPGSPSYSASATLRDANFIDGDENITYSNYPAPPGLSEQTSAEPSIGVNHKTGNVMYIAALDTLRVTFDDCSSPAKATWKDVSFVSTSQVTLDPILFCDPKTGRTIVSQLAGKESLMAFTDNDGDTWTPSQGSGINSGVDHQTVGGGRFAAPLTRDPNGPLYANAVYYCSQDLALAECARSDNGGLSFGPAVPIYSLLDCGGLHGHVKVSPVDGTVYVPNKGCGTQQAVVVSEDNGTTWQVRHIPGSNAGRNDPSVAVGTDGTLYAGWGNGHDTAGVGAPMVAVSKDKGKTWSSPADVGAQLGIKNTAFPTMVAGDGDRASFIFHGSTTAGPNALLGNSTWNGIWHLYVSHTFDGGKTWTTVNATPGDPTQRGQICQQGTGCAANRNLLDFMGATIDKEGRVLVGYADGCVGSCVQGGPNSGTAKAVIARQLNGRRMFAAFDGPAVPAAPQVTAVGDNLNPDRVHLSWSTPDDRGSPITGYRIYRRTGTTGDFVLIASVGAGVNDYTDTIDPAQTYFYRVRAVNAIGEGPHCGDIPVTPPPPLPDLIQPESVCVLPGKTILTDAAGDATGGRPEHDVRRLSIAEPSELGPGKIAFVLKMTSLASPPPNTTWPVIFRAPNGSDFFVRMATNPAGQVRFSYGAGTGVGPTVTGTNADPASGFSADGTIRIVVPRSGIGNPAPGEQFTMFQTRIRIEPGITPDNMPDDVSRQGSYVIVGSENCNKPPVAVGDEATTTPNTPVTINVLANDSDPEGDTLTITSVTDPLNGSVVNNSSSVTYTPDTAFIGKDIFDYVITDGHGNAAAARVNVLVAPTPSPNNPPNAANDTATTEADTPVTINVLANDSDPDRDPLNVVGVTDPPRGSVAATSNLVRYSPDPGFVGNDSFNYTISDGRGATDTATVTVTVVGSTNRPPTAVDDAATTPEDTPKGINVLTNDSDADGDPIEVTTVTQGVHGTVANSGGGAVRYSPDPNFHGEDSFTYTVSDDKGASATATVRVTVTAVNDPPVATDDFAGTPEDAPITISPLANDGDVDGDTLTITGIGQGAHGRVVKNGDGTVTYTPDDDFNGEDSFTYSISDGNGGVAAGTVRVKVGLVQDGYWLVAEDGGVFAFGNALFFGSMGDEKINAPVLAMTGTPSGRGYWLVARDGAIFSFGDAGFFGSTGNLKLNQPIVGIASTDSGRGYWLVARDGGIFAFGDAAFFGSTGNIKLNSPIVGVAPTPSGRGYWLVAQDGGIFAFGDAGFFGSTGGTRLNAPIVGMAATPSGRGYWLVATDGGIFAFGDARFFGSTGGTRLNQPIVGIAATETGGGYWLDANDGGVFVFGDAPFFGSMGAVKLNEPMVGMAPKRRS